MTEMSNAAKTTSLLQEGFRALLLEVTVDEFVEARNTNQKDPKQRVFRSEDAAKSCGLKDPKVIGTTLVFKDGPITLYTVMSSGGDFWTVASLFSHIAPYGSSKAKAVDPLSLLSEEEKAAVLAVREAAKQKAPAQEPAEVE